MFYYFVTFLEVWITLLIYKYKIFTFLRYRILLFLTEDNFEIILFSVILFEPYVLLLMRKITKFVIFGKKYRYEFDIWLHSHEFGALVEC
jgi:hypothetical protein